MGLIIVVVTVCLVAMTIALIRMRRTTVTEAAAETTDDTYEDISAELHTIKMECNEAYN
jgi:type VI protein secretion system component VasK